MASIDYIIKIILYFLIVWFAFGLSSRLYKQTGKVLSVISLLLISLLLSWYSVISLPEIYNSSGDRSLYCFLYQYDIDIVNRSRGLAVVFDFLRPISKSRNFLFFTTALFFIFITLLSYKRCRQSTPQALLLLVVSIYFIYGYALLKQNMANAFSCAAFVCFFNLNDEKRTRKAGLLLFVLLFVALSIVFHESAYLLLLVFPVLVMWNNRYVRGIGSVLIISLIVAFPFINASLLTYVMDTSEELESQVSDYVSTGLSSNILTIVKGLPFYIITIAGFVYRKRYVRDINNYDRYLFLSIVLSATSLLSVVNYWYFRFGMLLYLPVFVFAGQLYNELKKNNKKAVWYTVTCLVLIGLSVKSLVQYYFGHGGI